MVRGMSHNLSVVFQIRMSANRLTRIELPKDCHTRAKRKTLIVAKLAAKVRPCGLSVAALKARFPTLRRGSDYRAAGAYSARAKCRLDFSVHLRLRWGEICFGVRCGLPV
jgi:hypothetical protein